MFNLLEWLKIELEKYVVNYTFSLTLVYYIVNYPQPVYIYNGYLQRWHYIDDYRLMKRGREEGGLEADGLQVRLSLTRVWQIIDW